MPLGTDSGEGWKLHACAVFGLFMGTFVSKGTEYFVSFGFSPTVSIKDRSRMGPATVIIQGLGVGMVSTLFPAVALGFGVLACAELSGELGVAISAVGLLSILPLMYATHAFGPAVRTETDAPDALWNTTWARASPWPPPC